MRTFAMMCAASVLLACNDASSVGDELDSDAAVESPLTSAAPSHALAEPPFDSARLAGLTCTVLMDSVFLAPPTRALLLDAYGAPDHVDAGTEPNRHVDGAIDSVFDVYYPGLKASFRKPAEGPVLVTQMEVTDNRYLRYPSIGIGARSDRLLRVLDDPWVATDNRIEYNCGIGADEPVTFWLETGQVRRVTKSYYVD